MPRRSLRRGAPARSRSDALWDELRDCHRRIRAELGAVVMRRGIYLSEYRALGVLQNGPRAPSEVAERLGFTPASMTDLASQLVDRGWAERRPNPQDRRSHLLRVTRTGRWIYARARREYRARLAEVYGTLSPSARSALGRGLRELRRQLDLREPVVRAVPGKTHPPGRSSSARRAHPRTSSGRPRYARG